VISSVSEEVIECVDGKRISAYDAHAVPTDLHQKQYVKGEPNIVRSPTDDFGFRSPLSLAEERSTELRRLLQESSDDLMTEFREKLLVSWVYHDNALEGTVLSPTSSGARSTRRSSRT